VAKADGRQRLFCVALIAAAMPAAAQSSTEMLLWPDGAPGALGKSTGGQTEA